MTHSNSNSDTILVGMVQLNSTDDWNNNLAILESSMRALQHCDLIVLPEMAAFRPNNPSTFSDSDMASIYRTCRNRLQALAQTHSTWLIAGSMIEPTVASRYYNTTHVISPTGTLVGSYRKIHLFQATVDSKQLNESDRFLAGTQPLMCTINGWRIGITICFDLRFPELFCWYAKRAVDIIVVPSSFTKTTGKAHWHTLCQARAIENQCYIVAPNQTGIGGSKVPSYGHSLIVGPDGSLLQCLNDDETSVASEPLRTDVIANIRSAMPMHRGLRC